MFDIPVEWFVSGLALLIAVGALLLVRRLEKRTKSPTVEAILAALEKQAALAVAVAAKMAEGAILDGKTAFDAIDKKALADNCFALLPTTIYVDGVPISLSFIRRRVSQADWENLVQSVANEIDVQFLSAANYLASKVPGTINPQKTPP